MSIKQPISGHLRDEGRKQGLSVFSSLSLSAGISGQDVSRRIFGLQFGFSASKWQWLLARIGSVSANVLLK